MYVHFSLWGEKLSWLGLLTALSIGQRLMTLKFCMYYHFTIITLQRNDHSEFFVIRYMGKMLILAVSGCP